MTDAEPAATSAAEPEIHRADPAERRRNIIIAAVAAVCGALLLAALQHELEIIGNRIETGDMDLAAGRFLWLARGSFALLGLVGIAAGIVVGTSSLAVIREQRFPHAAARVVRDHVVRRGAQAVTLGRLGLGLALGFVVVGCGGAVYGWRLLALFQ